jgi:hypothetical protein
MGSLPEQSNDIRDIDHVLEGFCANAMREGRAGRLNWFMRRSFVMRQRFNG